MTDKLSRAERKELRASLERKVEIIPFEDLVPDWDWKTGASFLESLKKGLRNSLSTSTLNNLQRFPDIVSSRLLREAAGSGRVSTRATFKSLIEATVRNWRVR